MCAVLACIVMVCLYVRCYLYVHVGNLWAEYWFRVVINLIFLGGFLRLCHKAGLVLQDPLPVHFDHLPGC